MLVGASVAVFARVALFTRAWIEIRRGYQKSDSGYGSPSSRGRGLKYLKKLHRHNLDTVALFTRAWIEIPSFDVTVSSISCRPLHEGVD